MEYSILPSRWQKFFISEHISICPKLQAIIQSCSQVCVLAAFIYWTIECKAVILNNMYLIIGDLEL